VQLEGEATAVDRWQSRHRCLMRSNGWTGVPYLALEGEIKGLRAPMEELEGAMERKAEEEDNQMEGRWRVTCRRLRAVAAAAPDGWDRAVLRREQLASD
jgi:hypothetical protein